MITVANVKTTYRLACRFLSARIAVLHAYSNQFAVNFRLGWSDAGLQQDEEGIGWGRPTTTWHVQPSLSLRPRQAHAREKELPKTHHSPGEDVEGAVRITEQS